MCGIAGFWKANGENKELLKETVIKITDTLSHRGPDDAGFYIDENNGIALGHRRLSILDLSSKGHQPMESFGGRYIITYNGEVYNYRDLRKELENDFNINFKSNSDTEVLLAGFEVWGIEKTLKKSNGMFAFALWDKKEKRLYLARDRIGIKPLYYGVQNGILFFASELKAIRANRFFKPKNNTNALTLFFRYNYIPAPYSIYRDIKKLRPGHYACINRDLNVNVCCWWDTEKITERGIKNQLQSSDEEAVSELERLLSDSVKKRMIADVPLGSFLSGGVDSSTVAALMQSQSSLPIKTFTIGFNEDNYNEAKFAKSVAEHLGTDHTELYVTPKQVMNIIPQIPEIYDEPFSDSSQIPTFLISQLTQKHVTVSLSGDGGDELFGGYNRYFWADNIWKKIGFMPHFSKSWITKIITVLSPEVWNKLFEKIEFVLPNRFRQTLYGDKLYKLAEVLKSKTPDEIYRRLISHWKEPETLVMNGKEPAVVSDSSDIKASISDFKDRMMFFDLIAYLPDDILAKVDRASMGVSLEARVPILDHNVVEFAKKLPLNLKIKNGKTKWILRQILYKYVPEKLIERPKMGFGVPIGKWLRGPLREWAEDLLDENGIKENGILNPEPIGKLWQEHLTGKRNRQYLLWDVLMFQAWSKRWM